MVNALTSAHCATGDAPLVNSGPELTGLRYSISPSSWAWVRPYNCAFRYVSRARLLCITSANPVYCHAT